MQWNAGSNFKSLRGLDVGIVHQLLVDVAEKEMTMQEMISECKDIKHLKEVQGAFLKETGSASWDEAQSTFPMFTTAEALDEFRFCSFSQCLPPRFVKIIYVLHALLI